MRAVHLSILIIIAAASVWPQTTGDGWTTLAMKEGTFSVDMPSDFIAFKDNVRDEVKILGNRPNTTFSVTVRQTKFGKSYLAASRKRLKPDTGKLQSFVVGKYELDVYTYEKGVDRYIFEIASESAYFNVNVATRSANDPDIARFLNACKLDGKTFIWNSSIVMLDSDKTVYISDLKTSPVFTAALEHKQSAKIAVIEKWSKEAEPADPKFYSRPFMVLKREPARLTDMARSNWIKGEVTLSILFKGDGDIGEIRVLKGLGGGLTDEAINAAKKIKFLPAEIDGKPVDVERTIVYNFGI